MAEGGCRSADRARARLHSSRRRTTVVRGFPCERSLDVAERLRRPLHEAYRHAAHPVSDHLAASGCEGESTRNLQANGSNRTGSGLRIRRSIQPRVQTRIRGVACTMAGTVTALVCTRGEPQQQASRSRRNCKDCGRNGGMRATASQLRAKLDFLVLQSEGKDCERNRIGVLATNLENKTVGPSSNFIVCALDHVFEQKPSPFSECGCPLI